MITVLHRGGGVSRDPTSDYVICARALTDKALRLIGLGCNKNIPCHPQDFESTHSLTYNDPKLRGQTRNVSKNIEALNVVTFWSLNRVDSK